MPADIPVGIYFHNSANVKLYSILVYAYDFN